MSNEPNEPSDFFDAWWAEKRYKNDKESEMIAALAFAAGAQCAADSIERKLKEAIK